MLKRLLLLTLLAFSTNILALEPDTQAAKDEGMRLYGIGISAETIPYLEPAAEAGDVEAMYYLGEVHRLRNMGLTTEAMEWYLQAAEQGDVYAMLRLFQGGACTAGDECPEGYDDWHYAALDIVKPRAEAGDPDAMLELFHTYRMLDESSRAGEWLESAAEAGQPEAQTILGTQILDGRGWYWTNSRRLEAAEGWFRRAAEQGYVPAIDQLSSVLRDKGEYEEAWHWANKASDNGSYDSRLLIGACSLNPDEFPICLNDRDVVKGWAILHAIDVETQGAGLIRGSKRLRGKLLTDDQMNEAEALAWEEWIDREPSLSRFPPRFGF
ncbi:tetratricopeptide repeat protein [Halomonas sp. M4R5S39]|uniref:tetratricopeptide repeat protein n=1 Tax=Halomonas kalidii TaxID=3043293 RepID=UPI0024A823C7|nr:tetratricopeptide repeat protein [Halomonas kalidii]MDI5985123.1 tetratricopeptide repeat protein [Halomonas kalidii]